ncbi:MAG TPA: CRISPR system precrRNA processing endoribonuclease RAMP protein Cas6 [Thermoanaerobaculia bacterium]|nr:CRISPR system precrRNA processing endoribonuclease RAMP protein Cas6 [Thermoanaerobaculia bacterium]
MTDSLFSIPRIPYLRLRLTLRAQQAATLPAYKGSMLRGAFGHALRKAVCVATPEQPCATCLLRNDCYHTLLFEPVFEGTVPAPLADLPIIPRSYIFEPAAPSEPNNARHLEAGDPLEFDLLLFGRATDLQLYALLACERMAVAGLGRNRVPFRLESALVQTPDGSWRVVLGDGRMRGRGSTRPSYPSDDPIPGRGAVLHFLTPTRLRIEDDQVETVTFPELVAAMARRVFEVAFFHVQDAVLDWNLDRLLAEAHQIELVRCDLQWHDWERYNAHQHTLMNMGGFLGTVEIAGDLAPFTPLLRATEILHLGRGTPFGLGRMVINSPDGEAPFVDPGSRERTPIGDVYYHPLDPGFFL